MHVKEKFMKGKWIKISLNCLIVLGMLFSSGVHVLAEGPVLSADESSDITASVEPRELAHLVSKSFSDTVYVNGSQYLLTVKFSGMVSVGNNDVISSYDVSHTCSTSGPTASTGVVSSVNYSVSGKHLYVTYKPGVSVSGRSYYGTQITRTLC